LVGLYSIVTIGIMAYWWMNGDVGTNLKLILTVFTAAYTVYLVYIPAYVKTDPVKQVPDRVTF
jgi:hypothetical protein